MIKEIISDKSATAPPINGPNKNAATGAVINPKPTRRYDENEMEKYPNITFIAMSIAHIATFCGRFKTGRKLPSEYRIHIIKNTAKTVGIKIAPVRKSEKMFKKKPSGSMAERINPFVISIAPSNHIAKFCIKIPPLSCCRIPPAQQKR